MLILSQVEQLRDIIELKPGDADDEIVQTPAAPRTPSEAPGGGGLAVLGMPGPFSSSPDDWHLTLGYVPLYRNRATVRSLCEVYLRQVDPIIKILHRPSLSRWMIADERYLRYPEVHPTIHALEIAVCYAAVNSMSEVQCRTLLATTRSTALTDCREACEHAIGRTDLLTTRDITVLQAFVLYLVCLITTSFPGLPVNAELLFSCVDRKGFRRTQPFSMDLTRHSR